MPGFLALGAALQGYGNVRRRAIIFGILTALVLCFIWGQSMLPGTVSDGESGGIMLWLKPIMDPNSRIDDDVFHRCLRKAAHFAEYAALGFCLCGFLKSLPWQREKRCLPLTILLCVATAAIDEGIQLFTDGRSAKYLDVLLDSAGALLGIAALLLLSHLLNRHGKERT